MIMHEIFRDIDVQSDKVNRIINCAFEEFSKNAFDKASTNNIVKAAQVSRGLMYHHFKDKQELFDFLMAFSLTVMLDAFNKNVDWEEIDILSRIRQTVRFKWDIFQRYPYMLEFCVKHAKSDNIAGEKKIMIDQLKDIRKSLYNENIDISVFKEGIDIHMAIDVIRWTIAKYSEEYQQKIIVGNKQPQLEEMFTRLEDYIEFLKEVFYK